jgi:hydrogenase-4 component B
MNPFFIALLIIFAGGIFPLFLFRRFNTAKSVGTLATAAGCLIGLVDAGTSLFYSRVSEASFSYLDSFALSFRIDNLSAFFLIAIFAISLLAAIYSFHYMDKPEKALSTAVNAFFFSLLIIAMALVVAADNMITFMLAWEIMSISSFFLVIHDYRSEANRKAGYLYFVFSHVGAMFIFAAFGLVYGMTGSFELSAGPAMSETVKILVFVLAFVGFGSKAGVFPFHVWLPHAHPAAPSHISAVMSGVMIKTGIYGILRIYTLLDWHTPLFGQIVLIAGMVSGILGVVYALGQHDIKRLLAYHSVENIGIILMGIGIGMIGVSAGRPVMAVLGFAGGLLHVLNHSIFKSLLFFGAGMVLKKTGTRSIDALGGLLKRMKITGATFLVGSLAISGLPPFNGFVSEFLVYMAGFRGVALGQFNFVLSLLAIISLAVIGGLALACFSKVVGVVFQGEPRTGAAEKGRESGPAMLFPMVVLAAACFLIGIFPNLFVAAAIKASGAIGMGYGRIPMEPFMQLTGNITRGCAVFFGFLLLVMAARALLYRKKPIGQSGTWGCGFTQPTVRMQYTGSSYAASILEFFRPVAPLHEDHPPVRGRFPAKTDYHSHVNDVAELHMNTLVVRPVMALFDKLRWIQHGDIHLYIGYILLAIVLLLFFI